MAPCEFGEPLDEGLRDGLVCRPATAKAISTSPGTPITSVVLPTYTAEKVAVMFFLPVSVAYKGQEHDLSLVIVQESGPAFFGQDWLAKICLS